MGSWRAGRTAPRLQSWRRFRRGRPASRRQGDSLATRPRLRAGSAGVEPDQRSWGAPRGSATMSMSRPSSGFSHIRHDSLVKASKVLVLAGVCAVALAACAGKPKKPDIVTQQRPVELIYATGAAKL